MLRTIALLALFCSVACRSRVQGLDSEATAPGSLVFGQVAVGDRKELPVTVSNLGVVALSLEAAADGPFVVDGQPSSIAAGQDAVVNVAFVPSAAGTFSGTLTLSLSSARTPTLTVKLSGDAAAIAPILPGAPTMAVAPDHLDFAVSPPAAPAAQQLTIGNAGGSDLQWSATSDGPEISLSASSGTVAAGASAPALVSIAPAADATDVTRHITFTAPSLAQVVVPVNIHYLQPGAGPGMLVEPQSLTFSTSIPGAPLAQSFNIHNTGGVPLAFTVTAPDATLAATPLTGTVQSGEVALVTVQPASQTAAMQLQKTIAVASDVAGSASVAVSMTYSPPGPPPQYGGSVWPKFHQGNSCSGLSNVFTHTTGHVRFQSQFGPARQASSDGTYVGSPTLAWDGTVYQLGGDSSTGSISAFDPQSGATKWTTAITPPAASRGASIEATPTVVANGALFIMSGSEDSSVQHFYKLSAAGTVIWTLPGDGAGSGGTWADGFDSSPALGADGTLYIAFDEDPSILFFSQGNLRNPPNQFAKVALAPSRNYQSGSDIETQSAAIADDGTGYFSANGSLSVLSRGGLLWSYDATGDSNASSNMTSRQAPTLTPSGQVVYAWCSSAGSSTTGAITTVLTALPAGTTQGTPVWQTALPAALPVISIGPNSGTSRGFTERFSVSSPAQGPDGTIYIGHADGLYALDGATGAIKFHIPGATVASSPAVGADGTIFYGAMDGRLTAASPQGQVLWQVQTGGQVNSSPAVGADGAVFAASDDGFLYAVE